MGFFYSSVAFDIFVFRLSDAGKDTNALIATVLRALIMIPHFTGFFVFEFGLGFSGICRGFVTGMVVGSVISFVWVMPY